MKMVAASDIYDHELFMSRRQCADPFDESSMKRGLDLLRAYDKPLLEFLTVLSLDGLWMWDLEAPERSWMSPRFWRLLGYDPADDATPVLSSLVPADSDTEALARFAAYCAAPIGLYDEVARFTHRDGSSVWLRCRGIGIRDDSGKAVRLLGAHNDVTALKRIENELLRGKAELTQLLAKSSEANARLEQLVNVDSLTGLTNRRGFDEIFVQEWRRAAREGTPLSLVMVDLDRFKGYNDRYGHLAGDECLRRVAAVLADRGRRSADIAARYGGEEMVLLLPATAAAGAEIVAGECRAGIVALDIPHEGNMSCGGVVTASFGVATAMPADDSGLPEWTDLLAEADRQLYEAKRTGRNKVMIQANASRKAPVPIDEAARLATLQRYEAAGAVRRSAEMDRIARLAATLTGTSTGFVSLVKQDEQVFTGKFNLPGLDTTSRDVAFCAHTITGDEPLVVGDATRDWRFKDNPLVTGDLGLRYYAGAPIISPSTGHKLGALCVVDTVAREKTSVADRAILADLAGKVAALMEDNLHSGPVQES